MKMKTSELTRIALDWAVAKCEGIGLGPRGFVVYYYEGEPAMWQPSTDWAQGGPIIEREKIGIMRIENRQAHQQWVAGEHDSDYPDRFWEVVCGPTPLIAAMRCYVASKLGDEIEIPEELMCS